MNTLTEKQTKDFIEATKMEMAFRKESPEQIDQYIRGAMLMSQEILKTHACGQLVYHFHNK